MKLASASSIALLAWSAVILFSQVPAEKFQAGFRDSEHQCLSNPIQGLKSLEHSSNLDGAIRRAEEFGRTAGCYESLGQTQKAIDFYNQSLVNWRDAHDLQNEAVALRKIADAYRKWGYPEPALKYYDQAVSILASSADIDAFATVLNNRGLAYFAVHYSQRALKDFKRALEIYRSQSGNSGQVSVLTNIGATYNQMLKPKNARSALTDALQLARSQANRPLEAFALNNIGFSYAIQGDRAKAAAFYRQAFDISIELGDISMQTVVMKNIDRLNSVATYRSAVVSAQVRDTPRAWPRANLDRR